MKTLAAGALLFLSAIHTACAAPGESAAGEPGGPRAPDVDQAAAGEAGAREASVTQQGTASPGPTRAEGGVGPALQAASSPDFDRRRVVENLEAIRAQRTRVPWIPSGAEAEGPEGPMRRSLEATPVGRIAVSGAESLRAVLAAVSEATAIPIEVDRRAEEAVLDEGITFDFRLDHPVTAAQLFGLIAERTRGSVAWTVRGDTVWFTRPEDARGKLALFLHYVGDLVYPGKGTVVVDGDTYYFYQLVEPDDLATLIQENVNPASWDEDDVLISAEDEFLIVVHTPETHRRVELFLDSLRRFTSLATGRQATVELPAEDPRAFAERDAVLAVLEATRYDPRASHGGGSVPLRELADFLQEHAGVNFWISARVDEDLDEEEQRLATDLSGGSVRESLDAMCARNESVDWEIANGVVQFITVDELVTPLRTVLYDVRLLCYPLPDAPWVVREWRDITVEPSAGLVPFDEDFPEREAWVITADSLEGMIRDNIDFESWDSDPRRSLRVNEQSVLRASRLWSGFPAPAEQIPSWKEGDLPQRA